MEFTDRFWRSQRGVMSVGGRFALPGMLTVLPAKVNLMSLAVEADVLRFEEGTTQRDLGVEMVAIEFFDRRPEQPVRAAVIDLKVAQQDAPFKRGEEGRTDLRALTIQLDVLSLAGISLSRRLSLGARGGIGIAVPTHLDDATLPPEAPSSEEGEKESVPSVLMPTIFGDFVYRSTALPFVPNWSSLDRYVAGERGQGEKRSSSNGRTGKGLRIVTGAILPSTTEAQIRQRLIRPPGVGGSATQTGGPSGRASSSLRSVDGSPPKYLTRAAR